MRVWRQSTKDINWEILICSSLIFLSKPLSLVGKVQKLPSLNQLYFPQMFPIKTNSNTKGPMEISTKQ